MVKIGEDAMLGSKLKTLSKSKNGASLDKKNVVSPAAGVSEDESSLASEERRPSLKNLEVEKSASKDTKKGEKGQTGKDTSSKVSKRGKKEFYENTVIDPVDVGKTLLNKMEETDLSADAVTELSPTETKLLDAMIFKGYASHEIFLRKGFPVSFRSCPPFAMEHGYTVLMERKPNSTDEKTSLLFTCMVVGVFLESYGSRDSGENNLYFSHKNKKQEEFASEEAIRERFEFCSNKLNGTIVDTMNKRLVEFLNLLGRIGMSRNIINF